ncbi:MAG: ATP-binding cassette domain-containing protein [Desulfomonilaceae bacterium]
MAPKGVALDPGRVMDPALHVLEFHDVSKAFQSGKRRVDALRGVSFRVRSGIITGLIGPDGAGKTTIMRLAAGLLLPNSGRITVLGIDVGKDPTPVQASVGYMPQHFGLYEDLTVRENLDLFSDLQGVPHEQRPPRYEQLLHMTGLKAFTRRLAGRLSGGMKQKLGLACTLVRSPQVLLLDEPTVGVDPVSRRELWAIVGNLVEAEGMSVLLSTAYLDEAERCGDVVLIYEGQILGAGPPSDYSSPMKGRTYRISAPGVPKRGLQRLLESNSAIVDAVIQGEQVRVVLHSDAHPDAKALLPGESHVVITEVKPRFEDGFIAMLRDRMDATSSKITFDQGGRSPLVRQDSAAPAIKVENLKRRFGDFYAVKGITFDVGYGEVFGLLGANGAGKSTTFRMLCGLLPPSDGKLQVAGMDLRRSAAAARARIGYMSQKFSLYGILSVLENIQFYGSVYGLPRQERRRRIQWALEQFDLDPVASAMSADLPLGYKQRLALACALMHQPDILFLDEPTSGVDPLARREFWRRIAALAQAGVTVLVTTHFMEEAEYCDRLAIMADGDILAVGTPEQIKERVRSDTQPEPTMEDAFIHLLEEHQRKKEDPA